MNALIRFLRAFLALFSIHTFGAGKGHTTLVVRLFGFRISFGWHGNCHRYHLNFQRFRLRDGRTVSFVATLRWRSLGRETKFYLYMLKRLDKGLYIRRWVPAFSWNCMWIAEKFGEASEQDFGTVWHYRGILGQHDSI